jgi:hypothetical protein
MMRAALRARVALVEQLLDDSFKTRQEVTLPIQMFRNVTVSFFDCHSDAAARPPTTRHYPVAPAAASAAARALPVTLAPSSPSALFDF